MTSKKLRPVHICSNPGFDVFVCRACHPEAEPIAKDVPICKCGLYMILYLLDYGLAQVKSWRCPRRHWWNGRKHSEPIYGGTC